DRREILAELGVAELELPAAPCEDLRVPRVARRQHAIEQIDAALDGEHEVLGRPDAHEVARAILGQQRARALERRSHELGSLADGEAADRIALEAERDERAGALLAEVRERAAL